MMKSLPRSQAFAAVACLALLLGLTGCRTGGVQDDPVLRLSADEAFTQGKAYLETEKYAKARNHLTHAFELEPNSRQGREALLMVADSYYLDGGLSNFIQAEAKYRDFLNRFPTSDQAAYAQFQIANSLARRIQRSDRDQTPTLNALSAYEELIRLYPTSQYAEEADEQMAVVRENLAAHELTVGKFNYQYKNYLGAIHRLEKLLENYPDFSHRDQALLLLGKSYAESSNVLYWLKAKETYDRLRREYPDSRYASNIPELPPQPKPRGDAELAEGEEPGGEGDAPSEGAPAAEDMEPVGGGR